jgi:hypothetical protein
MTDPEKFVGQVYHDEEVGETLTVDRITSDPSFPPSKPGYGHAKHPAQTIEPRVK